MNCSSCGLSFTSFDVNRKPKVATAGRKAVVGGSQWFCMSLELAQKPVAERCSNCPICQPVLEEAADAEQFECKCFLCGPDVINGNAHLHSRRFFVATDQPEPGGTPSVKYAAALQKEKQAMAKRERDSKIESVAGKNTAQAAMLKSISSCLQTHGVGSSAMVQLGKLVDGKDISDTLGEESAVLMRQIRASQDGDHGGGGASSSRDRANRSRAVSSGRADAKLMQRTGNGPADGANVVPPSPTDTNDLAFAHASSRELNIPQPQTLLDQLVATQRAATNALQTAYPLGEGEDGTAMKKRKLMSAVFKSASYALLNNQQMKGSSITPCAVKMTLESNLTPRTRTNCLQSAEGGEDDVNDIFSQ